MAVLDERIAAWTSGQSARQVLDLLHDAGVPAGLVYEPEDMLADPHFRARQSLVEVPDPEHGHITMPAVAPRLSDTPAAYVGRDQPSVSTLSRCWLSSPGLTPPSWTELRQEAFWERPTITPPQPIRGRQPCDHRHGYEAA